MAQPTPINEICSSLGPHQVVSVEARGRRMERLREGRPAVSPLASLVARLTFLCCLSEWAVGWKTGWEG